MDVSGEFEMHYKIVSSAYKSEEQFEEGKA